MVIYIQERFTEVRACLEELTLPPAFTPTAVQLLHLPAPPADYTTPRHAGVELFRYVGPRTIYAALGGTYTPDPSGDTLQVHIAFTNQPQQRWHDALKASMDEIYAGLAEEFLEGVVLGLERFAGASGLRAGVLRLDRAAVGDIGSSIRAFIGATRALCEALGQYEQWMPIKSLLRDAWEVMRRGLED